MGTPKAKFTDEQLDTLVRKCRTNMKEGRQVLDGLSEQEIIAVQNRYSVFDDGRDAEGFLTTSAVRLKSLRTPRPFVHLMATNHAGLYDQWGAFWDQHGGGFSCADSVLAGRMTSHLDTNYVPTAPEPQDVRSFYVHEDGKAWPMFPIDGYEVDRYSRWSCVEGMDKYQLQVVRASLESKLQVFVHPDMPLEVWRVTLTNKKPTPRKLTWFAKARVNVDSFPFYYFVPRVVCEGVMEEGAMVFLNHDKGNKHPRTAFMLADRDFDGFDMMGEVFDGGPSRAPLPDAVQRGRCSNSLGFQPYAGLVAAAQFDAELAPGESKTWTVVYGKAPDDKQARADFLRKLKAEIMPDSAKALEHLDNVWKKKVTNSAIKTPDTQLDRYFNIWSKYQLRNQSRFGAALDKVGYRDILQYTLGTCDFEPQMVRTILAETVRYQYPNGMAVRQYEKFKGGGHDLRLYHDSAVWIPDSLARYIKETGDLAFLDEVVPFMDPQTLRDSETETGTIYEHACRAVRSVYTQNGYHGLCKIGYGDWADAISGIGGEKGVSVWLSCACVYAAKIMADLAEHLGKDADHKEFAEIARTMTERINEHAWDGQWYIYAINGEGLPIGSKDSPEGRIHLNVNTWAIFTGVAAAAGREEQVWKSIEQLASPFGHLLLKSAYTAVSRPVVGRIADIMPGMCENSSVYTHGEAFYLFALMATGKADKWLTEMYKTLPSNLVPDIATGPPHQQSNFSVGPDHVTWGSCPFSNFTGSVGWFRRTIEKVIGVSADYKGLRIAPQPPSCWDKYQVKRTFRGSHLLITFRRGREIKVLLDGQKVGGLIPTELLSPGKTHKVDVTYV